jgi:uncharacterized protein (DUF697 family)
VVETLPRRTLPSFVNGLLAIFPIPLADMVRHHP